MNLAIFAVIAAVITYSLVDDAVTPDMTTVSGTVTAACATLYARPTASVSTMDGEALAGQSWTGSPSGTASTVVADADASSVRLVIR